MRIVLAALAVLGAGASALADDFPSQPIRLVVPFSAGGPTDVAARLISEPLRKQLGGQTIVIENRPGASGVPGTEQVATGPHDGYSLVVGGIAPIVLVPVVRQVRYDVDKDFVPLGLIWRSPQVLAVRPNLDVKTVAELIAYAKANPGKANFGSAGIGTVTHLAGELFKREAGIDLVHIPYRSTSNSLNDLMGGQIDMIFGDTAILAPQIQAGSIKVLAINSAERSPVIPDVPTMKEVGLPNMQTEVWFGLFAPARTPPAALEKLKKAVRDAQMDPEYRAALAKHGTVINDVGSEGLARFVAGEKDRWTPVLKATGITF